MEQECWPEGTMKERRKKWHEEFEKAKALDLPGSLEWSQYNYEAFRYTEPGVTIIFYPHTVKRTFNQHIRVREQHSKDKDRAFALMRMLNNLENCCTFDSHLRTHISRTRYNEEKKRAKENG